MVAAAADLDLSAQPPLEHELGSPNEGVFRIRNSGLGTLALLPGGAPRAHSTLRFSNRPPFVGGLPRDLGLLTGIVEREDRTGMSGRDAAGSEEFLHSGRQAEKPEGVGHRRTVSTHVAADFLLGQAEAPDKLLVAARLFQGREILTLEILDQRHDKHVLVAERPHDRGHRRPAQGLAGAEAPLAGNDLEPFTGRTHDDGLKQAVGSNRARQVGEAFGVEVVSGLERVGANRLHLHRGVARGRRGFEVLAQQGREALAEASIVPRQGPEPGADRSAHGPG